MSYQNNKCRRGEELIKEQTNSGIRGPNHAIHHAMCYVIEMGHARMAFSLIATLTPVMAVMVSQLLVIWLNVANDFDITNLCEEGLIAYQAVLECNYWQL